MKREYLVYEPRETLRDHVLKELVTFIMLCGCAYVSRLSTPWLIISLFMWGAYLWDIYLHASKKVYTFNSKYAMQKWLDSFEDEP